MRLKGDTLIEVALAIGIFSLVAITVVSVVSASTTGAQSSLEVTITREELDGQAEALRFIHEAYVSGSQSKKVEENKYEKIWGMIAEHAVEPKDAKLTYSPELCSALYQQPSESTGKLNVDNTGPKPFIINIRKLGDEHINDEDIGKKVVVAFDDTDAKSVFFEPSTYPRIVYKDSSTGEIDGEALINQVNSSYDEISRVEGLFIVAVKGETQIISGNNEKSESKPAYYDFYIRSCWMPVTADRASTISTVVRLYDPAVITY